MSLYCPHGIAHYNGCISCDRERAKKEREEETTEVLKEVRELLRVLVARESA